ncbi:MAG: GDSL-type esterase/lipase family protein [Myxococcota bacterium]
MYWTRPEREREDEKPTVASHSRRRILPRAVRATSLASALAYSLLGAIGCGRPTPPPAVQDAAIAPKPSPEIIRPARPDVEVPSSAPLHELLDKIGGREVAIEMPCARAIGEVCVRWALDRSFAALDRVFDEHEERPRVRVLFLGDSHIAADYVTKTARSELQRVFGDAGRGYIHADQKDGYGGRRLPHFGWTRHRMVDFGEAGGAFGFSGFRMEATSARASSDFKLDGDERVRIFVQGGPGRGVLRAIVDNRPPVDFTTTASAALPLELSLEFPKTSKMLHLVAPSPSVALLGISFETSGGGVNLDAVGPVGSDAITYASAEGSSFSEHVRLLDPILVVLMLGGNDALRVREGKATFEEVRQAFLTMLYRAQAGAPRSDCLLIAPMDAGDHDKTGKVVSKALVREMRDLLHEIAVKEGCGFWDLYQVMGEEGSIARWSKAGIMNPDLIHPRAKAGELIGSLFAESFVKAWAAGTSR